MWKIIKKNNHYFEAGGWGGEHKGFKACRVEVAIGGGNQTQGFSVGGRNCTLTLYYLVIKQMLMFVF